MSHSDTSLLMIGQFRVEPTLVKSPGRAPGLGLSRARCSSSCPGYEIEMSRMIPMRDGTEQAWITKPSATKEPAPALQVPLAAARVAIH